MKQRIQTQFNQLCKGRLLAAVLDGYNATALAYGHTGAGKTFTIFGTSLTLTVDGVHICKMLFALFMQLTLEIANV